MSAVGVVAARPSVARLVAGYVELTKPRIVMLVVMTALPALLLARRGMPDPVLAVMTLLGTSLAAASAAAFNHWYDRDIDGLMRRTRTRPLPAGMIPASHAFALGTVLGVLAVAILASFANPLAALLGAASIFYYAVVYTIWLKRRTPQNIVIGGGAGASAPLIAWAAVTGTLGLPALVLSSIVFLWTPPHFWSLALYRSDDYQRAGIPMLPVTHGAGETRRQIVLYTWVLVPVTLALVPLHVVGPLYAVSAAVLGALFLGYVHRLARRATVADAVASFRFSIAYLFLIYLAMTADALVRYVLPGR